MSTDAEDPQARSEEQVLGNSSEVSNLHTWRWTLLFALLLIYLSYSFLVIHDHIIHAETKARPVLLVHPDQNRIAMLLKEFPEIALFTEAQGILKRKAFYSAQIAFLPSAVIPLGKDAGLKFIGHYLKKGIPVVFDLIESHRRQELIEKLRQQKIQFSTQSFGDRFLVLVPRKKL